MAISRPFSKTLAKIGLKGRFWREAPDSRLRDRGGSQKHRSLVGRASPWKPVCFAELSRLQDETSGPDASLLEPDENTSYLPVLVAKNSENI